MSVGGSRAAFGVLLGGVFLVGLSVGVFLRGGSRSGLPKADGYAVFGMAGDGGNFESSWAEVRASASRRSLLLLENQAARPQLLVFPMAGSWPAVSVPTGWEVAWLAGDGQVLEVEVSKGQPLVPKSSNVSAILAVPASAPCRGLAVGRKVFWGSEVACPVA